MLGHLTVAPDNQQHHLEGAARDVWRAFERAVPSHPLAGVPTDHAPAHVEKVTGSIAIAIPNLDRSGVRVESGAIALGERFWADSHSEQDRFLTLLHEGIHLRISVEKLSRTIRSEQIRTALIKSVDVARAKRLPDAKFQDQRAILAIRLHLFPDEVWAELYLRDHYPEWFDRRVAALVRMREDTRQRDTAQMATIPERLRGCWVAYELMRLDQVIGLASDAHICQRLEALKQAWTADLSSMYLPTELGDFADALREPLPPDADFEARFDRYCNAVMTIAP